MTLLLLESFESFATGELGLTMLDFNPHIDVSVQTPVSTAFSRNRADIAAISARDIGSRGLIVERGTSTGIFAESGWMWLVFPGNDGITFGASLYIRGQSRVQTIVQLKNDGEDEVMMTFQTTSLNGIMVRIGGTGDDIEAVSLPAVFSLHSWSYFEFRVKISNSAGIIEVRIDNKVVINLTNIDTDQFSSSNIDRVLLIASRNELNLPAFSPDETWWDDIYVLDDAGSVNNDFLGDIQIYALSPDADTSIQWTPLGAGTSFSEVDESTTGDDGDTSYVSTNIVAQKDIYGFPNLSLPSTGTIPAIQIRTRARDDGSGQQSFHNIAELSASESNGATHSTSGSYDGIYADIYEVRPGGGSWAPADIDTMQGGIGT